MRDERISKWLATQEVRRLDVRDSLRPRAGWQGNSVLAPDEWRLPGPRWTPRPGPAAAIAAHVLAPAALLASPTNWPWVLAALAGSHLLLAAFGLWPSSQLLGRTITRLPPERAHRGEVALTFDDGPDPDVTPAVLDILDRHGAQASFFLIGRRAAQHPGLVREIVRRGHQVENHTWRHLPLFACLGLAGQRREVAAAQALLTQLTGRAPRFLRAPAGLRSPLLDPVLHHAGLLHVSWTRRALDGVRQDPGRALARLLHGLRGGDVLLLHDGGFGGRPVVLEVLPGLLAAMEARGLVAVPLDQPFSGYPAAARAAGATAAPRPAPAAYASR